MKLGRSDMENGVGEEDGGMFVVHHIAGPLGVPVSFTGDFEADCEDYTTYDEQSDQTPQQLQQPIAIPQQIRVLMMVPKQCRANYANFYCVNRRLQSIPEAACELSERSSTADESPANLSSARNSRILENGVALPMGAHSQEEMMALINAASASLREQYSKLWPDSITPHKLAIRQLLSSPDLPFIDSSEGSAGQTRTTSQNDLTAIAVSNTNGGNNTSQLQLDETGSEVRSRNGDSKPFGTPRFVKKLVGYACCCAPKSSKL